MYYKYFKRIIDIVLSSIILICSAPILLLLLILVLIIDKQFPVYIQDRSGKNFNIFRIYKIKSMKFNSKQNNLEITKLGKLIRVTKLDEIPQLLNVLKNDMSLIGPRPLYSDFDNYYKTNHKMRSKVKPGITGLAQVKLIDSTNWNVKFNYDVIYVKKVSLYLDFYILLKTIGNIFSSLFVRKKRAIESLDYKKDFFKNYKI